MEELIELLKQIQELAGVGIEAIEATGAGGEGAPPEGGEAPPEEPPAEEPPA